MRLEKWTQPYWETRRRPPLNSLPYWNYWLTRSEFSETTLRSRSCGTKWCQYNPPPLPKNEEKHREEILDHIEEGWQGKECAIKMSQIFNEILRHNLLTKKTPPATRTNHEADGIQWIRIEELGKAFTNSCQAIWKLKEKRRKTQRGTIDRHTNSEQLEFECQLKTPTRSRIHELLNLGASSSHNLFQSLITN